MQLIIFSPFIFLSIIKAKSLSTAWKGLLSKDFLLTFFDSNFPSRSKKISKPQTVFLILNKFKAIGLISPKKPITNFPIFNVADFPGWYQLGASYSSCKLSIGIPSDVKK